jgi:hypothetical protein
MLNLRVYLWLGVLLAAAAGLSFSHFTAYRAGKANVRNEWQAATAAANLESFKTSERRQRNVDQAVASAAARENRLRADARDARSELGGLRDDLDAAKRYATQSAAAAERTAEVATGLLERCSERYLSVAESAQRSDIEARQLREAWPH